MHLRCLRHQINKLNIIQCNLLSSVLQSSTSSTLLKFSWKIIKQIYSIIQITCTDHAAFSNVSSTSSTYPGSCKSCFSRKPVFGGKVSLIFLIMYQIAHLHNWPLFPLIFADNTLDTRFYPVLTGLVGKMSNFLSSLTDFIQIRCVLASLTSSTLKLLKFILLYLIWSCLNRSLWWLCMRHTRSTTP